LIPSSFFKVPSHGQEERADDSIRLGRKWLGRLGGVISSTSEWKRWIGKYRNPKKTNAI
jgi:hypothetical protein